jgi:hypothetical protein
MNASSTISPSWRRLRRVIPASVGISLFIVLTTYVVDAVRKARNAADVATTT